MGGLIMRRKGQLFVIEVLISLTILIVLVTALFSTINFSPPPSSSQLEEIGENVLDRLVETGEIFSYFEDANYSYYTLYEDIFDNSNETKKAVSDTITSSIPLIANYKAFTYRYNETVIDLEQVGWEQVDIINFETTLPVKNNIVIVEYYTPGFYGQFVEFKFQLHIWYEVEQ